MAQAATLTRIADIAEDQWGLITRRQASDAGVSTATLNRLAADNSVLKRVAHGVYRLAGAPEPEHQDLKAAWLQLAPAVRAWERDPPDGTVSHRSAADMYGLGHLGEDRHEFTLARRRQSRRPDVRLHHRPVREEEWIVLGGLPVTRPARIASDLLYDREDPTAVAHIIGDALRGVYDYPGTVADALGSHAARFGLRRGDGLALLRWLLDLLDDLDTEHWMSLARAATRDADTEHAPALVDAVAPQ
jgi:Transcriptional regulator, AbiEi antitoxin